jgi:hypothetical protein
MLRAIDEDFQRPIRGEGGRDAGCLDRIPALLGMNCWLPHTLNDWLWEVSTSPLGRSGTVDDHAQSGQD